jgi:plastocyanin
MPNIWRAWLPVLSLAAFSTFASGQDVQGPTGAVNDTTPTSTQDEITIHTIDVSNKTHYFTPNSINALPGDIVTFRFWPGNHSVIRAEYGFPCVPYEDFDGNEKGGFYSGVQSPDQNDVEQGNVCIDASSVLGELVLTYFIAPHMELDHQHDCADILLLWCSR